MSEPSCPDEERPLSDVRESLWERVEVLRLARDEELVEMIQTTRISVREGISRAEVEEIEEEIQKKKGSRWFFALLREALSPGNWFRWIYELISLGS